MSGFDSIGEELEELRTKARLRRRRVLESPQGCRVRIDGKHLLNFCSNNYLDLAADQRIAAAFKQGVERWGTGAGASQLVCGHSGAHADLEAAIAEWTGRERALVFGSGFAANTSVINALLGQKDWVYQDRLNHASLLDGGWLSRARFNWYAHQDLQQLKQGLEQGLQDAPQARHLIVSDGTFSMDGDFCQVDALARLAGEHRAWLMIDDAHGVGVLGDEGHGLVDPARHRESVQILMGTFGKAFGTAGAFIAGSEALIEYLIQKARDYIFTTATPAALAEATLCSLGIVRQENWRREKLRDNISWFRDQATARGIPLSTSESPIQPIIIGAADKTLALSEYLEAAGILITPIRPPTVPENTCRLRITFSAGHQREDIQQLVNSLDRGLGVVNHG